MIDLSTRQMKVAALAASSEAHGVTPAMNIKALDWQQSSCKRGYTAVTPVGQFAVFDEGDPRWAFSLRGGYDYYHVETFEDAKRDATAYYEKRVMSMIEH